MPFADMEVLGTGALGREQVVGETLRRHLQPDAPSGTVGLGRVFLDIIPFQFFTVSKSSGACRNSEGCEDHGG